MGLESAFKGGYSLDGKGGGARLDWEEVRHAGPPDGPFWIHLRGDHDDTFHWLEEHARLDSLVVNALMADETRPRLFEYDEGVVIILRGVNLNEKSEPEDMVSIRCYVDDKMVISISRRDIKAAGDIEERFEKRTGPRNTGELLTMLVNRICDRMEPTLGQLNERMDDIEEEVLERPDFRYRQSIVEARKEAIIFRRYLAPQRDVLMQLRSLTQDWMDVREVRRVQESLDRVTRFVEDLDAARERGQIIQDELSNVLNDRLNRNMYTLSIIAAIFLPLGFLTGLLGINVGGIPGANATDAFWIFTGMLVILIVAQIMLYRKLHWL